MIRIQNIYYMLAYAFQVLHEQGYKDVATEDFENTAELLSAILCRGVSVQIKRGLCRQYITNEEPLGSPRGKIEIGESIKTQAIRKKQLVCSYDEFSVDAYTNRIIKATMMLLLRANIAKARKKELRKLLIYFDGVSVLDIHTINWDIQYDRNNQTYRMIIEICYLVIKGLLQTTADGSTRIMDYADDQTMAKLYEKFILGYFQREHPEIKAYSPQIAWQVTDGYKTLLPTMQSDIVISNRKTKKTLIIDAKYYSHNMQMKAPYMTQTLHSGNLYQIFTYVKNWSAAPDETISGMLLYARTDDGIQPDNDYQMSGNQISVKTLDLDSNFTEIAAQLDAIAERIM
jgi:5-methylcytosine-specific restriction enzyme subunit McrC